MSDLISRKELIERIVNRTGSPTVLFNTTEELNAYLEGCAFKQNDIIDIIDKIPTAYDVEKVIEEIEDSIEEPMLRPSDIVWNNAINMCLEVVRNGGKE